MLSWKPWGAIAASLLFATAAHAGSMKSTATMTLTDSLSSAYFSGNDTNQINGSFQMFGLSGWALSDKNDDALAGTPITFSSGVVNGTKSGSWAVNSWSGHSTGNVVVTLKAGKGFTAFLVNTNYLNGNWTSSKDLSHASIYTINSPGPNPAPLIPTPLPAGFVLLLTGLAGFGFARFRSTK